MPLIMALAAVVPLLILVRLVMGIWHNIVSDPVVGRMIGNLIVAIGTLSGRRRIGR